jgi:hypothetical protein
MPITFPRSIALYYIIIYYCYHYHHFLWCGGLQASTQACFFCEGFCIFPWFNVNKATTTENAKLGCILHGAMRLCHIINSAGGLWLWLAKLGLKDLLALDYPENCTA